MNHRDRTFVLVAALVALAAGCDDDTGFEPDGGPLPQSGGQLRGTIVLAADGARFGPTPVDLFDLRARAVLDRTEADSSGVFVFDAIVPGEYLPVIQSDVVAPFVLPRTRYVVTGDERFDDVFLVAPIPGGLTPDEQGIAGRVVDAANGEPVAFARVEMNSLTGAANWSQSSGSFSEYRGHTSRQETTADAEGTFRIVPVPIVLVPVAANPSSFVARIPSWRVVAPGYRSRSFPAVTPNGTVQTFEVRLESGVDDGEIGGRVVGADGLPREGVPVVAEWRRAAGELIRQAGDLDRAVIVGEDAISGPDGRFRIGGLADGAYNLRAGPATDDGWVDLTGVQGVDLNGALDVGDILVARPLEFLDLRAEYSLGDTLRWTPVDGAATYRLRIRRGLDLQSASDFPDTTISIFDFAGAPFDTSTVFRLTGEARDDAGNVLTVTDGPSAILWTVPDHPTDPGL